MTSIERLDFDAAELLAQHPPILRDPNKRVVFGIACRADDVARRTLGYSRWAALELPEAVDARSAADLVDARDGYFDYEPLPGIDG